eukprot:2786506-Amphidinium_carterae.1
MIFSCQSLSFECQSLTCQTQPSLLAFRSKSVSTRITSVSEHRQRVLKTKGGICIDDQIGLPLQLPSSSKEECAKIVPI